MNKYKRKMAEEQKASKKKQKTAPKAKKFAEDMRASEVFSD